MAARRRRGRPAPPSAPPPQEEAAAPPQARAENHTIVLFLAGALLAGALLGLAADLGPTEAPGLWRWGLGLAAVGALGVALSPRVWPGRAREMARASGVLCALALWALLGRNQALGQDPFRLGHLELFGLPAHLAWVALAGAARAPIGSPGARLGTAVAALASVAALGWPGEWLGEVLPMLGWAAGKLGSPWAEEALAAAALLALAIPALAGIWLAARPGRRAARLLAQAGVPLLALHHLLTPLLAGTGAAGLGGGVVVACGLALITVLVSRAFAAHPDAATGESARWVLAFDLAFPAGVLALYALLKTHGFGASDTDENIYFYMAADLGEGRWPYVDYFFAHPPLHLLLPGALFEIFGFSLPLAKLVSATAGGIAGLCVWAIGRRHLGRAAGALALCAFLSAAEVLKATTNMTGVDLTTMWLMLGVWQSLRGHGIRGGLCLAAAAGTGFYSMGAICALLALGLFRGGRWGAIQLTSFALALGALNLAFYLAAGDAFVDGVYRYHEAKTFQDPRMVALTEGDRALPAALWHNLRVMTSGMAFTKEVFYHAPLWAALALAPLAGAATWWLGPRPGGAPWWRFFDPRRLWTDGRHGMAGLCWLVALALFVQYAMFRELYSFYFLLIYPLLALLLGYLLTQGATLAARGLAGGLPRACLAAGACLCGLVALSEPWSRASGRAAFPDETEELGKRNEYEWTAAPALGEASGLTRELFWKDERHKGDGVPGVRHYLWNKKRSFVKLDEIAAAIRDRTDPGETLAGASTLAPLIALRAGRRLAAGEADTNHKRFRLGLLEERTYWEAICQDRVRFLIAAERSHFTESFLEHLPTARRWFQRLEIIMEPGLLYGGPKRIALYERVGPPPGEGRVCQWEGP